MQAQRIRHNKNLLQRTAFRTVFSFTLLIQKGNTGTQHSSGFVPFLQVPPGFGQGQEEISPENSIIYIVMTEEHYVKQGLKENAAFLLNSKKEGSRDLFYEP